MKNIIHVGCSAAPESGCGKLLRASGYNVSTGTISQVLPALRSGRLFADLIIAECHALNPEIEELLWQLKRAAPKMPFILMTNRMTVESYLRSLALGIHDFLNMPVDDHAVLNSVRALIRTERSLHISSPVEQSAGSL